MSEIIVAKFGGTSLGDARAMYRSANIVVNNPHIRVVVVSAMAGITNKIATLIESALQKQWSQAEKILAQINNTHFLCANELRGDKVLLGQLGQLMGKMRELTQGISLLGEASPPTRDRLFSLGERLSSQLFNYLLGHYPGDAHLGLPPQLLDARQVIKTSDNFGEGAPLLQEISLCAKKYLLPLLSKHVVVTQGFIGRTLEGHTTTLGRGGSDYTAALLTEAIGASSLQIWTDVPGIFSLDPRLCESAHTIEEMSFMEAAELAYLGAKVLHPMTLIPTIRQNIPVFVGSTFHDDETGTWVRESVEHYPLVRALALRENQTLLTFSKIKKPNTYGHLGQIFTLLAQHKISVDLITTSEISTAMTVYNPELLTPEIIQQLAQYADLQEERHLSMISVIGKDIVRHPGAAAQIFKALEDFPIRFICLGAGHTNLSFLVSSDMAKSAVLKLHSTFLETKNKGSLNG